MKNFAITYSDVKSNDATRSKTSFSNKLVTVCISADSRALALVKFFNDVPVYRYRTCEET